MKDKWHFCYWDEPDFSTDKKKLINNKETKNSDINSIVRGELEMMNFQLTIAKGRRINRITKYHYRDCLAKIKEILYPKN